MRRILRVARPLLTLLCLLSVTGLWATEEHRVFHSFNASHGLADNSAQTILCTRTGRMVITTIGHINFYDGDAFTHIDPKPEDLFSLPKYNGHYRLFFDRHHHLWLKDKRTVSCVDLMTERFVHNVQDVISGLGMDKPVDDLFGDTGSQLWCLSGERLYGIDVKKAFPVNSNSELQDVDTYQDRQLLMFYGDGVVSAYDLKNGSHLYNSAAFTDKNAGNYASSSVICRDSNMYYQIRNGEKEAVLLCFDVERRQWRKLLETPYHLNNMVVRDGIIYIASEYGYWTYETATDRTDHIQELTLTRGRKLLTDINTLCFDRQGGLWLGTERRGVLYSRPYDLPFACYTWDDPKAAYYASLMDAQLTPQTLPRHVNCQFRDSRGWLWTGRYTGLQLQKPDEKTSRLFTKADGLMNEMIHSIVEDDNNDIWAATSYGVSHLVIGNKTVQHIETYYSQDNVPAESFTRQRALKLDNGDIIMQSLDHIIKFNPESFHTAEISKMELYPKLIKLSINGHNIDAGTQLDGRTIIDRSVTRLREITVNYKHNSLVLTFSGLNFMRPIQTVYRFRVKGVFNDWHIVSHNDSIGWVDKNGLLHLPLLTLPAGTYEVEMQASMSADKWPVEPQKWTIKVEEPWWRSTGIYLLLMLLLLVMLLYNLFYFYRNTRLRMLFNNEEEDLLKRINNYVMRCEALMSETLSSPTEDAQQVAEEEEQNRDFNEAMLKIIPFVRKRRTRHITLHELSDITQKDTKSLLTLLSANLSRSPRYLAGLFKLQEAACQLTDSDKTIEEIAGDCGFGTPNNFIASFYHRYRMTPAAYRKSMPR